MKKTANKQKIAQHAAYSRKNSVRNNCIPLFIHKEKEWEKKKYKQPPKMPCKDYHIPKLNVHSSEYIERYVQHRVKKWEKKNPCPIKLDGIQQDLFEKEFLNPWKQRRIDAEKQARTFVISVYGQFSLVGRFKISDDKYEEKEIKVLKDIDGSTVKYGGINHCSNNTNIVKSAFNTINAYKKTRANLISATLKDNYNKQGRIVLPELSVAA